MSSFPRIGVVAASSAVPMVELELGVEFLRAQGLEVRVHEHLREQHFHFAGTDARRAGAFYDFARDPEVDVIWMARGGYGATRLLPLLDDLTYRYGIPPRKLLVGYSDVTVLHEFVRGRWNWATLHAPMPASSTFPQLKAHELAPLLDWVRGKTPAVSPWPTPLTFVGKKPGEAISRPLIGGNLTLWQAMMGTRFAPKRAECMLFFEDIGEQWYKVDRMVTQLDQAGAFEGVLAIILGDFTNCEDDVLMGLPSRGATEKVELRRRYSAAEAIEEIFGTVAAKRGMALAKGLPVGHGPNYSPLPLGGRYTLHVDGRLVLEEWDWVRPQWA